MELSLTPAARTKLQTLVSTIRSSPRYFNQMVTRAQMYMPFIEEAFEDAGVPTDLKYLAIQESSLQPSVVSSSNAVGFWQFKKETGLEVELRIDEKIDERRHIFRASEGAATYLKKANRDFDNWVYAVISYYEGPTGAIIHTDPIYYSQRTMLIDETCHWYVLKAIAHKLAYEVPLLEASTADWYLKPYSTAGETHLDALIREHRISPTEFFKYNPWLLDQRRLPRSERPFTYYLPVSGTLYTGHQQDPTKGPAIAVREPVSSITVLDKPITEPATDSWVTPAPTDMPPPTVTAQSPAPSTPVAASTEQLHDQVYASFPVEADLDYGASFVTYTGEHSLPNLAILMDVTYTELLAWNRLKPGQEPEEGRVLYLTKPKKSDFHIVRPGETLAQIADMHGTTTRKVQRKNRMKSSNLIIFEGQKLHLKKKKAASEKLIILVTPQPEPVQPPPMTKERVMPPRQENQPVPPPAQQAKLEPAEVEPTPPAEEKRIWIEHPVEAGETLWQISQRYDTKVAIIQRINNLETDSISPGQVLHILVRQTVLEDIARAASRGEGSN